MDWLTGLNGFFCSSAGYGPQGNGGWHMMGFPFGGWIMLLIIVVAVFLATKLFSTGHSQRSASTESPQEILKRRYASGEIDKDEYERMKRDLAD